MAETARRLLCVWVRPTLWRALEERARTNDQALDDEVRDLLARAVSTPRVHLRLVASTDPEAS